MEGAWKSSIIYRRADVVSNQGGVWIAAEPSQNRVHGIGAYWDVLIPASVIGSLPFVAKPQASSASIDPSFHSVQLFGSSGFSDGRGGLFIDSNNGSDDTFTSADGRTWYRNSIAIKAGHPEAVANSVMGVQYSLEEDRFRSKTRPGYGLVRVTRILQSGKLLMPKNIQLHRTSLLPLVSFHLPIMMVLKVIYARLAASPWHGRATAWFSAQTSLHVTAQEQQTLS